MAADRRSFLKRISALGAAFAALGTLAPALRTFASPLFARGKPREWVRLGEASEFELDVPTKVDFVQQISDAWVESRALHDVWVFTDDGETFMVYSGRCPHLGCGFGFDAVKKEFHCPCHHGLFAVKDGAVKGGPPPRGLDMLETKIEHGILYVDYRDFRVGVPDKIPLA